MEKRIIPNTFVYCKNETEYNVLKNLFKFYERYNEIYVRVDAEISGYANKSHYKKLGYNIITYNQYINKKDMSTLKDFVKTVTLKEPHKSYNKAGIINDCGDYSQEVKDMALEELLTKHIETKDFQDVLKKYAKEIIDAK